MRIAATLKAAESRCPDPVCSFGLRADDVLLTHNGARLRFKVLVKHVFESGDLGARTSGPRIPLWKHLNVAKGTLFGDGVSSRRKAKEQTGS